MRLLVRSKCPSRLSERDYMTMRRLIWETDVDGFERGFFKCTDKNDERDYVLCTGTECNIALTGCKEPLLVFHTHPTRTGRNYSNYFSIPDVRNVAYERSHATNCLGFVPEETGRATLKCIFERPDDVGLALSDAQYKFNAINSFENALIFRSMSPEEQRDFIPVFDGEISKVLGRLEEHMGTCTEVIGL